MVLISYFRPDQVKIQGQNEEMLLAACEQFLSKSDDEIQQVNILTMMLEVMINRDEFGNHLSKCQLM